MPLSGLETAIRSALERSDRENAEQRARIYQSARQALEAGLQKKNIADPTVVETQRQRLEEAIHRIELEERQRLSIVEPTAEEIAAPLLGGEVRGDATPPPATAAAPAMGSLDGVHADRSENGAAAAAPASRDALDFGAESFAPRKRRGSRLMSRLFIWATLLVAIGMGAWWVYSSDVLLPPSSRDTGLPSPTPSVSEEDFDGTTEKTANPFEEHQTFNGDWVDIFKPAQITALQPRPNATADIVGTGEAQVARLLARSGDDDGSVAITVPVDALRDMAGKTSTIAVTMKSASEEPVRIAISCDFGRLGECPRHRFTVNSEKLDVLFRVSFDKTMAPSEPGTLILHPDLDGKGGGVDIFGIRVLPGN